MEEAFTHIAPRKEKPGYTLQCIGQQHSLINEDIERRVYVETVQERYSREDYVEDTTEWKGGDN